jgi:F0F1-type ATP synthase assembly protein I
VFDQRAKQQLNRGYSDGMARGTELVLSMLVLGGIGWLLDSWLGTGKVFTIIFGFFGVAGAFAKLKLGYDRQMRTEEQGKPWAKGRDEEAARPPPSPPAISAPPRSPSSRVTLPSTRSSSPRSPSPFAPPSGARRAPPRPPTPSSSSPSTSLPPPGC